MYQTSIPQATVVKTLAARAITLRPQQTARIINAVDLVLTGAVRLISPDVYRVESGTRRGLCYLVRQMPEGPWQCACPDQTHRGGHCKHGMAAKLYSRALEVGGQAYGPSDHHRDAQ